MKTMTKKGRIKFRTCIFKQKVTFNPFMTEADIIQKPMDWFLYDNGFRHERIKVVFMMKS